MGFRTHRSAAGILIAAGGFLVFSSLMAFAGMGESGFGLVLAWLGGALFESFHAAALYAPIYLFTLGILGWKQKLLPRNFAILTLGFIPALLGGLTLRLIFTEVEAAPLAVWFREMFGVQGSTVISGALTVLSLAVLVLIPLFGGPSPAPSTRKPEKSEPRNTNRPVSPEKADVQLRQEEEAVSSFKQGVSGLLQTKVAARPTYPDLDDIPPQDPLTDIEPDTERKKFSRKPLAGIPELPPGPVLSASSGFYRKHEGESLEVYFSKDGSISDYPPKIKSKWDTLVEDPKSDPEPGALDHPAMELARSKETVWSEAFVEAKAETAAEEAFGEDTPEDYAGEDFPEDTKEVLKEAAAPEELAGFQEETVASAKGRSVFPLPSMVLETEAEADPDQDFGIEPEHDLEFESEPDTDLDMDVDPEGDPEGEVDAEAEQAEAEVDTRLLPPMPAHVSSSPGSYKVPIVGILDEPESHEYWLIDEATTRSAHVLKMTLQEFGIQAEVTGIRKGPVITMFEILPAPGVKLAKIVNLADNIALRLAAQTVRIVAPIPGKHAVGIEIPNRERSKVAFSELLAADNFTSSKMEIPVALGKDITGDAQIIDLTKTPHLLIAGSTGSGKSVCVNALISSILYRRSPAEVNLILIDPKIVELKFYNDIPHLLTPVITDPKKAFQALQWCLYEMERRYSLLDAMQVRDIKSYNKKVKTRNIATPHMPYLVVIIDEFADLMATSGKELEGTLARLAAMSRAVGIHLVLATQRPSTDVITGLIKANIPSRIAFMVASKIDSRIILDSMGAEKLLGKGDMLFTSAWDPFPTRMQGAFLSDEEVERVVSHVKTLGKPDYIDDEIFFDSEDNDGAEGEDDFDGGDDPLMRSAIEIVVTAKKASASYLQRRLKIGYNRAARLVEKMEEIGVVGPSQGSKPREILRMFQ